MVLERRAAVFMDRDGTLIRDVGYLKLIEEMEVLPRVAEGLALLRDHGFKLVLTTNQSAVGRGFLTEGQLDEIHAELQRRLGVFDGVYYCPHHPTAAVGAYRAVCSCRKPEGGMVTQAARDLALDPAVSYVVGDQPTDMHLAHRVGAKGVFIGRAADNLGVGGLQCAARKESFYDAARWILEDRGGV